MNYEDYFRRQLDGRGHRRIAQPVTGFAVAGKGVSVTLGDGSVRTVKLLVAADGARSRLRERAGIPLRGWSYGQSAIVTYDMRAESIASGVSGTSFNTASVTVNEPDSLPGNNVSTNAVSGPSNMAFDNAKPSRSSARSKSRFTSGNAAARSLPMPTIFA